MMLRVAITRAEPEASRTAARVRARDRLVLTVGDATAEAAREAGFNDVRSADGDVNALVALAKRELDPARGKLIHIAGDHVAGDLGGELRAAGFSVERRLAYASVAAAPLPPALNGPLDIVLFHSPRAAQRFIELGAPNAANLVAGCMSAAIAEAAGKVSWRRIITAPRPREDDLLAATLGG